MPPDRDPPDNPVPRRHRGGRLLVGALISLIGMPLSLLGVILAFVFTSWWMAVCVAMIALTMTLAIWVAACAFNDLRGMGVGRVNPAGQWRTVVGGVLAVFSVLLHWAAVVYCIWNALR